MKSLCTLILGLLAINMSAQVSLTEDFVPGSASSTPQSLTKYNGNLYFTASTAATGAELYKYDGTNITLVMDYISGTVGSSPGSYFVHNNILYYSCNTAINGRELHRYNGINTTMVSDISVGTGSSGPNNFVSYNGNLYFTASTGANGRELYKYDGNTVTLIDIWGGSVSSNPQYLTVYKNKLYFSATRGTSQGGVELYSYEETTGGGTYSRVADIWGSGSSLPKHLTVYNDTLFFQAYTNAKGTELYKYGGSGSPILTDIVTGSGSSEPKNFYVSSNNTLYFTAYGELFSHDSTGTTTYIADIYPGALGSQPNYYQDYDGKLFFNANTAANGKELWVYDYNNNTVSLVEDIYPGTGGSDPQYLTVYDSVLYFSSYYSNNVGFELTQYTPCPAISTVDTQTAASSFVWIDGITYTASNDTATYTLTSVSGCDSVVTLNLTIGVSITKINKNIDFKIYPNPVENQLIVETDVLFDRIQILNTTGQLVATETRKTIDVSKLSSGIYIIQIQTEEGINQQKFVKQ